MQRAGRVHVFYFRSVTRFFLSPGQDYSGAGMRHMVCMDVGKLKTNKQNSHTQSSKNTSLIWIHKPADKHHP